MRRNGIISLCSEFDAADFFQAGVRFHNGSKDVRILEKVNWIYILII